MHYTPHCIGEFIDTTLNEGFSYLLDEKSLKRTYVHCPFLRRSQSLAKVFNSSKCHRSAYYLNKGQVHLYLIPRCFSLHFQKKTSLEIFQQIWQAYRTFLFICHFFYPIKSSMVLSPSLCLRGVVFSESISPTLFFLVDSYSYWVFNMQSRNSFYPA